MGCLRLYCTLAGVSLALASTAKAVYAPISDVEKGRLLTTYATVGGYYDTNIFGGPYNERASWVTYVAPQAALNWNPRKQMLLAGNAGVRWDNYDNRPSASNLFSYNSSLRLAYTFSPRLEAEVSGLYSLTRNPESLLAGANTLLAEDQTRRDVGFDSRVRWTFTPRNGLVAKVRGSQFHYRTRGLSVELDRQELLTSLAWTYLVRPRSRAVFEHRSQLVRYRYQEEFKDKDSQLFLVGLDYSLGRTLGLTSRAGAEWRQRTDGVAWRPYGEVGAKWDYAKGSYLSGGYAYVIEEVANVAVYNDISVHRFFLNLQHALTPTLTGGLALGWEPSRLNTRRGVGRRASETNWKLGASLEKKFSSRWSVILSCDYDDITSDDTTRGLHRLRTGLSSRHVF